VQQNHAASNAFGDLISPKTPSAVSSRIMQARAFSIPMLPSEDRVRWIFLKKKATQLPGFYKEQNRKCCSCPAAEPVGKPSGRASAIGSKSKPIAFGLVGACSPDDSAAVGADVHRSKGAHVAGDAVHSAAPLVGAVVDL
jgi:hypothetical protein